MSTSESIEDLVSQIQSGKSSGMSELYERVRKLIIKICNRYRVYDDPEDLQQEAYFALVAAVDGYDPERGVKFTTYLCQCVERRIRRYLDGDTLSYSASEAVRKYERFCCLYRETYGDDPTDERAAAGLGVDVSKISELRRLSGMVQKISTDAPVGDEDGNSFGDLLGSGEDLETDVLDRIENQEISAALWAAVDALPDDGSKVIRNHYQDQMTLGDIAQKSDTPIYKVRYTLKKSLNDLRRSKQLRASLAESSEAYRLGLQGTGATRYQQTFTSSTERAALRLLEREEGSRTKDSDPEVL